MNYSKGKVNITLQAKAVLMTKPKMTRLVLTAPDGLYLHVVPRLLELLEPEVSLAGVQGRGRGDACTLFAVLSSGHCLHGVKVLRLAVPLLNPLTGAPAQRPDQTLTAAVRPLRHSLHFIIVPNELKGSAKTPRVRLTS